MANIYRVKLKQKNFDFRPPLVSPVTYLVEATSIEIAERKAITCAKRNGDTVVATKSVKLLGEKDA